MAASVASRDPTSLNQVCVVALQTLHQSTVSNEVCLRVSQLHCMEVAHFNSIKPLTVAISDGRHG